MLKMVSMKNNSQWVYEERGPFTYTCTCFYRRTNCERERNHKGCCHIKHYTGVIMTDMESEITGVSIVCSVVWSCADRRNYQSSATLAFVRGVHKSPVNSLHKRLVTHIIAADILVLNLSCNDFCVIWLTWGRETHTCASKLCHHWFR